MNSRDPVRAARQSAPNEPAADCIRQDKEIPDPRCAANGISEDVEHVVPVIG